MNTEYVYIEQNRILMVHPTGVVETSSWPIIIGRSMEEGRKCSCTRFLFDQRDADFRLNVADLFGMPHNTGAFKQPLNTRIALLLPPLPPAEREFIGSFNSNRGFNVKVFHDRDLAIGWLEDNASPPDVLIVT
jgi:hypothetical protein